MASSRALGVFVLIGGVSLAAGAWAQAPAAPAAPAALAAPAAPAADTAVVTVEAIYAVVLPMKGSYMQHPDAMGRLGSYLAARGITPSGPMFGRYFSDPSVGEENLVWEVGLPVAAGAKVEAPYEIREIPATSAAVHLHKGPMEELGTAWGHLVQWVITNGYQPAGPAMQVFKGDMMSAPEVEMRLPVAK